MKTRLVSALLFLCAFAVRAADVVNNITQASTGQRPSTVGSMAQAFDTGAEETRLNSITLRLQAVTGTSRASVQLWTSASGSNVPETLVENLGDTADFTDTAGVQYTVASPTKPVLAAQTRYWVVVKATDPAIMAFQWSNTGDSAFLTDTGSNLPNVGAISNDGGASWSASSAGRRVVVVSTALVVTNTNDSGAGSLRQALADAATFAGPDTITFDPALSGQTITLNGVADATFGASALIVSDSDGMTVDASALPAGITLQPSATGFRCFQVPPGGKLALHGLTVASFTGQSGEFGGAIRNTAGNLSLMRCTLTGNTAAIGGAIFSGGGLTLQHCTLTANTAQLGGAIYGDGGLTLRHCTVSGNTATTSKGGGVDFGGTGTFRLENSIVAGNSAPASAASADIFNGDTLTCVGANLVQALQNDGIVVNPSTILNAAPQLAALGSYGGPTKTMPPLAGSAAIDAAVASSEASDQRGASRTGAIAGSAPDLGAVELAQIVVNTAADENNGIGTGGISLREAIALNTPLQAELIRFDPAVFTGATPTTNIISLGNPLASTSSITVSNRLVSVDARDLPAGLTINDGTATTYRLFYLTTGSTASFAGLTLADGGGLGFSGGGGAIFNFGGTVELTGCTLSGNQVADNGGAIYNFGKATLTRCTLSGNVAHDAVSEGGALYNGGSVTLTQCTLFGNSADVGGAISNGDTMGLTHCTLSGNSARIAGAIMNKGASALALTNTIVGGNTLTGVSGPTGYGADIYNSGNSGLITRAGANIVPVLDNYGSIDGSGTISSADPKLAPSLASNGGPTKTIAMLDGSPARNAAIGSTATTDQRGFPLLGTADLGAYERQLGPIDDQTSVEDVGFSGIDFSVGQVGTLTASSDTPAVVPNGTNLQLGTSGPSRTVALAPAPDANGSATITITDSLSGEKESFQVTFAAVNDAPFFTKGGDVNVFVDATAQTLTGWATGISPGPADESGQQLTFAVTNSNNVLFAAQPALATDGTLTFTPAPGVRGVATVTVTLSDNGSNAAPNVNTSAAQTFSIGVRLMNPQSAKVVSAGVGALGDPAPDAGVNGIPGGPTAGATLVSLGVPCVDDRGNIAYLAKWQSSPKDKSSGFFYRDAVTASTNCLLGLGGAAAPVPNATIQTLGEPVGSTGYVALLGTIKVGAKTVPAVFSNTVGGRAPQVVAQAGDDAGAGGAKFKSFKAIEVAGGYLGVLAQLAPSATSTPKTTVANDTGLWIKDGGDPLTLVLREGQEVVAGKIIKTLVAFAPGNGSPGQGRGWLREKSGGGAIALALCLFTDKTQGIVTVDYAAPNSPVLVTYSGLAGIGGPFVNGVANPTFASFGVPARNGTGSFAFLAALKPDTASGVTKANASGVFTGPTTGGYYGAVARVGDDAGATGGKFSQIKDVALGEDGTFAFPATIKGTAIKGPAASTLWWQPAGKAFQLLAQGGTRASQDLPADAQWKSFTSLAVPGSFRGPLFAATLIPNKTGVTATNSSGVWAVDFTGAIRMLFRTGVTQIDVGEGAPVLKTVKSFTLLKATVGSTGVTRSFNDAAQVVWLATFTDKSQAIVTTEVP